MERDFYIKIRDLFTKSKNPFDHYLYARPQNTMERDFNLFLINHLKPMMDAADALKMLSSSLSQKDQTALALSIQLMQKLEQSTGDRRLGASLSHFLGMQKEAKHCKQVIDECSLYLAQLKHSQFELEKGQEELNLQNKIKRIVKAVNVYDSFLISCAAEQSATKLVGKELQAYNEYSNNCYIYAHHMVGTFRKVEQNKQELILAKDILARYSEDTQEELVQTIQNMKRMAQKAQTEAEEVSCLFEKMLPYIKQRKSIPSKYTLYKELTNHKIINSFNALCRQIEILYRNQAKTTNGSINPTFSILGGSFMGSGKGTKLTYQQLTEFVNKMYHKVTKNQNQNQNLPLNHKMGQIEQLISSQQGYSASVVQEALQYSELLNRFVISCLKYFSIESLDHSQSSLLYNFAHQDLKKLTEAIEKRLLNASNREETFKYKQEIQKLKMKNEGLLQEKERLIIFIKDIQDMFKKLKESSGFVALKIEDDQKDLEKNPQKGDVELNSLKQQIEQLISNKMKILNEEAQFQVLEEDLQDHSPTAASLTKLRREQQEKDELLKDLKQKIQKLKEENSKHLIQISELKKREETKDQKIKVQDADLLELKNSVLGHEKRSKEELFDHSQVEEVQNWKFQYQMLKEQYDQIYDQKLKIQKENQDLILEKKQQEPLMKKKYQDELSKLRRDKEQQNERMNMLASEVVKNTQREYQLQVQTEKLKEEYQFLNKKYLEHIQVTLNKTVGYMKPTRSIMIPEPEEGENANQNVQRSAQDFQELERLHSQFKKQSENEIAKLKNEQTVYKCLLDVTKSQNKRLNQVLEAVRFQNTALQQSVIEIQLSRQELSKALEESKKQINSLKLSISQLQSQKQKLVVSGLNGKSSSGCYSTIKNSNLPTFVPYTKTLFSSYIFAQSQTQRQNLVNHIQTYTGSRIFSTSLLLRHDIRNKSNFHNYIDNVSHLVVVVKTSKAIVSAYYPGVYQEKEVLDKGGLIVAVDNNKSYQLRRTKGQRGMIYDSYFVIFGNAQLRIKPNSKTVYSNFGISNSYFNHQGEKVDVLLHEGDKREVQFQQLQFYQIILEKDLRQ